MYTKGRGVKQDDAIALSWYRKAADQGDALAQYNLGAAYAHGSGVKEDRTEALKWFGKSAAQGNKAAAGALRTLGQSADARSNAGAQKIPTIETKARGATSNSRSAVGKKPVSGGLFEELLKEPPGFWNDMTDDERKSLNSRIRIDVEKSLIDERRLITSDPARAARELMSIYQQVAGAPFIDSETRDDLRKKLREAMKEAEVAVRQAVNAK